MTLTIPPELAQLPVSEVKELLCREHVGVWAQRKLGFSNAPLHWEWYRLVMSERRLCVVAPREHGKTQIFTVAQAAWRSIYWPGHWTYVFAQTGGQAQGLLERIDQAVEYAAPRLTERAVVDTADLSEYGNGSKVTVAGMGKAVRSVHPDLIIGDDVLSDETCATALQREKVETWWHGTVGGMTHPGTDRLVRGELRRFAPTRVFLVGTAFHAHDLLLGMKTNLVYRFRRYAAEFHEGDLVDGLAVEVA